MCALLVCARDDDSGRAERRRALSCLLHPTTIHCHPIPPLPSFPLTGKSAGCASWTMECCRPRFRFSMMMSCCVLCVLCGRSLGMHELAMQRTASRWALNSKSIGQRVSRLVVRRTWKPRDRRGGGHEESATAASRRNNNSLEKFSTRIWPSGPLTLGKWRQDFLYQAIFSTMDGGEGARTSRVTRCAWGVVGIIWSREVVSFPPIIDLKKKRNETNGARPIVVRSIDRPISCQWPRDKEVCVEMNGIDGWVGPDQPDLRLVGQHVAITSLLLSNGG